MVVVDQRKRKNKVIEIKRHRIIKIEQIKLAEALIHVAVISYRNTCTLIHHVCSTHVCYILDNYMVESRISSKLSVLARETRNWLT